MMDGKATTPPNAAWTPTGDLLGKARQARIDDPAGENPPGRSSYLRQYARNRLTESAYNYWRNLARLHNQQHKPSLPENDFRRELHYVGIFLTLLSDLLPDELRLASEIWSRMADG